MTETSTKVLEITIGAVRTRGGHIGQVKIDNDIVWEGDTESGYFNEQQAVEEARYRVIDKLGEFLRQPTALEELETADSNT